MAESVETQVRETRRRGILPLWLAAFCAPSRMLWLAPLLGLVLTLPSMFSGYVQDDHLFRQYSLETTVYAKRPVWDYFNWLSSDAEVARYREQGTGAWWWTPSSARFRFLRPIASVFHAFEFRFFDGAPWVLHLNRALLYALAVFLAAKLLNRLASSGPACGVACLIFAVDDNHAYSAGWISAANTLIAWVFGLFALLMHDYWRRSESRTAMALSVLGLALSLLSSEGGLALAGYLIAYAVFLESGTWKRKALSLLPSGIVLVGYLLFYRSQHFGVTGSFSYLAPAESLGHTSLSVFSGVATGVVSQILSIPALCLVLQGAGIGGALSSVAVIAALIALFWRFLGASRTVGFFALGAVLSLLPFTIGMMGDRYLLWAGFGAAGLLGELFANHVVVGTLRRAVAKTLLITNTVVSLLFFVPLLFWLAVINNTIYALERSISEQDVVVLNGHGIPIGCAAAIRSQKRGQWPKHVYFLYEGLETLSVTRIGERTLRATTPKGWFSSSVLSRAAKPKGLYFWPGQTFELEQMTARIEQTTDDGRPLTVSFAFKKDLGEFTWIQFSPTGPEKREAPALGEEMRPRGWAW